MTMWVSAMLCQILLELAHEGYYRHGDREEVTAAALCC